MCTGHCLLQLCLLIHSPSGTDVDEKDHDQIHHSKRNPSRFSRARGYLPIQFRSRSRGGGLGGQQPLFRTGKSKRKYVGPPTNKEIRGSQKPCEVKQPSSFLNHHVLGQTYDNLKYINVQFDVQLVSSPLIKNSWICPCNYMSTDMHSVPQMSQQICQQKL